MLRKSYNILKNKFVFTTLGFLIWIFIFDRNNLLSQIDLANKLHQLKQDKEYYINEIRNNQSETIKLLSDPYYLEKFARETYLMKRDSEDIFLVIQNDSLYRIYK